MKKVIIIRNGKELTRNGVIVQVKNDWGKSIIVEDLDTKNNVVGSLWENKRYQFSISNIVKIEGNKIYIKEN